MSKPAMWLTAAGRISVDEDQLPAEYEHMRSKLASLHRETPLALMTMGEDREFIKSILRLEQKNEIKVQKRAIDALYEALEQTQEMVPPLKEPTDFETIGLCDEIGVLTAKADAVVLTDSNHLHPGQTRLRLTKGKEYAVSVDSAGYRKQFIRNKVHYSEASGVSSEPHTIELIGKDSVLTIMDDDQRKIWFRSNAIPQRPEQFRDLDVWKYFEKPSIPTIKEKYPDRYNSALDKLSILEMMEGFTYYPGQKDYIARMACLDSGLIAAETGCGKSLIALSLMYVKDIKRGMFCAPKGTVDGVDMTAQWCQEAARFRPDTKVYKIFSKKHYDDVLKENGGELPEGIFITYPYAYFESDGAKGKAFETIPASWRPEQYEYKTRERLGLPAPDEDVGENNISYSRGVGETKDGFREIWKPSLATQIGDVYDGIFLDEAHLICNPRSARTQAIIRMQATYRYGMSATPLPNMVKDLFSLMGWICVPKWFHGRNVTAAWPYALEDMSRFRDLFQSKEYDRTAQEKAYAKGKSQVVVKDSAVVSQAARLLKCIKTAIMYAMKSEFNPDLVNCNMLVTKVPMGKDQLKVYSHFIQPGNMPSNLGPKERAGVQQAWLRSIAAGGPNGLKQDFVREHSPYDPRSNYNPKTVMVLEKIRECVARTEQVVVVYSRLSQGNEIASRLEAAGIGFCRIDSTKRKHAKEATAFKEKKKPVMLMGIGCAQAYSFQQCPNLIIGSLEWSYGKLNQAMGRVFRLNSERDINIYCILHKDTIEELIFDRLCTKQDAATICLRGEPVEHEIHQVNPEELMAEHVMNFNRNAQNIDESVCEQEWPALKSRLFSAAECYSTGKAENSVELDTVNT